MKAVLLTDYGDVDKLVLAEVAEPEPGPGEVKVRVAAASINPIDYKLRHGDLRTVRPLDLPAILGRDVAGVVTAVGRDVRELAAGDRVMGLVEHAYAEVVVGPVESFAKLPPELDALEAATLPLAGLTGSELIEEVIDVKDGELVLVTGALGSVGRAAVFAAKRRGARVIAGVRAAQLQEAAELRPDRVIAIDDPVAVESMPEVDAIADTVGGEVIELLVAKLKRDGVFGTVLSGPAHSSRPITVRRMLAHADRARLAALGEAAARGIRSSERHWHDLRAAQRQFRAPDRETVPTFSSSSSEAPEREYDGDRLARADGGCYFRAWWLRGKAERRALTLMRRIASRRIFPRSRAASARGP